MTMVITFHIEIVMYKFHNSLLPNAFQLFFKKSIRCIITIHDWQQNRLIIFQKQEQTMEFSTYDSKVLNYGMQLMKV